MLLKQLDRSRVFFGIASTATFKSLPIEYTGLKCPCPKCRMAHFSTDNFKSNLLIRLKSFLSSSFLFQSNSKPLCLCRLLLRSCAAVSICTRVIYAGSMECIFLRTPIWSQNTTCWITATYWWILPIRRNFPNNYWSVLYLGQLSTRDRSLLISVCVYGCINGAF